MKTVYYAIHPDATNLMDPATHKPGVVFQLEVFEETSNWLGCKVVTPGPLLGHVWSFKKHPKKFFGDILNGLFSTPGAALARCAAPIPTFLKEGKNQWIRN